MDVLRKSSQTQKYLTSALKDEFKFVAVKRVIPNIKAWPHCSRRDILEEPFHLLSSQGVGGLAQMRSVWQLYNCSTPSSAHSSLLHSSTRTDHKSTPLYPPPKKHLVHTFPLRECFSRNITYNIVSDTDCNLK